MYTRTVQLVLAHIRSGEPGRRAFSLTIFATQRDAVHSRSAMRKVPVKLPVKLPGLTPACGPTLHLDQGAAPGER
jgi:hypothetical protein